MRLALGAAILAFVASAAQASTPAAAVAEPKNEVEARYTPDFWRCIDGAGTVPIQTRCVESELDIQDGRLNVAYGKAMGARHEPWRGRLQAAQRAWIVFRNTECALYDDGGGGSISRINIAQCLLEKTVRRTIDLEAYPEDGDP